MIYLFAPFNQVLARDDTGWLKSPARKTLVKQWRLPEYWRKHDFPPQCKPIGESDFDCR